MAALTKESADLWDVLMAFGGDSRQALFAHCVSLSVDAIFGPYNRRSRALAHADRLAEALDLDMTTAGWTPAFDNYLGKVTKAQILDAARDARGEQAAQFIEHLKKGEKAEALLAGSGWLPEPLRTQGHNRSRVTGEAEQNAIELMTQADGESLAANGGEPVIDFACGQRENGEAADPTPAVAAE